MLAQLSLKRVVQRVAYEGGLGSRSALLKALPKGGRGAEVGVWRGDFSALLLSKAAPSHLTLIDPWQFQPDLPKAWYGGARAGSQADMDVVAAGVAARFGRDIRAGRVTLLRMDSKTAADSVADRSLDWVYIDGDHTFDGVRGDLGAFLPKVRPGGFIAGDDYGERGWWGDSVTRAVMDFIRSGDTVVVHIHKGQFLLQLPD